jgi:glycine oxidase
MGFGEEFEGRLRVPDLAVVGGGLLGRLLAWRAARAGMSVGLYEAGGRLGEESAAWAAAGMVAPASEALDASPEILAMGRRSLELWPDWLKELPVPVYYRDSGTMVVWGSESTGEAERLEAAVRENWNAAGSRVAAEDPHLAIKPPDMGHPDAAGSERVGGDRLRELEPVMGAGFGEAIYLPGEGQVDNREVLAALALALEEAGVVCRWNTRIEDEAMPAAGVVADCRGMGGREAMAGLRGVRGEILRLHAPGVELRHMVRLIGGVQPIYLVPRAEGRMVVGATAYESEDRSPASVGGVMRLLSAAVSVLPELAEARILEFATQVRPAFADRQPVMRWDESARILRINGLYRHGFLLSPAVVEEAMAMLLAAKD